MVVDQLRQGDPVLQKKKTGSRAGFGSCRQSRKKAWNLGWTGFDLPHPWLLLAIYSCLAKFSYCMDPFQVWLPAMATHTKSITGGHWWAIENPITAHDLKSVYRVTILVRSWYCHLYVPQFFPRVQFFFQCLFPVTLCTHKYAQHPHRSSSTLHTTLTQPL